jgi:hypothetical protein
MKINYMVLLFLLIFISSAFGGVTNVTVPSKSYDSEKGNRVDQTQTSKEKSVKEIATNNNTLKAKNSNVVNSGSKDKDNVEKKAAKNILRPKFLVKKTKNGIEIITTNGEATMKKISEDGKNIENNSGLPDRINVLQIPKGTESSNSEPLVTTDKTTIITGSGNDKSVNDKKINHSVAKPLPDDKKSTIKNNVNQNNQ